MYITDFPEYETGLTEDQIEELKSKVQNVMFGENMSEEEDYDPDNEEENEENRNADESETNEASPDEEPESGESPY